MSLSLYQGFWFNQTRLFLMFEQAFKNIDELRFRSQKEKHELSHLYEAKIKNMGNAGRNGGEYYTPRPLSRAMVRVVAPKIGESIYDGAVGSAGFLCESFDYLKGQGHLTTKDMTILHTNTLAENLADIQEKDRYDVVLANPPLWREGAQRGAAEFPDSHRGNGLPLSPTFHQEPQSRRTCGGGDQEYVPVQQRQCLGEPA